MCVHCVCVWGGGGGEGVVNVHVYVYLGGISSPHDFDTTITWGSIVMSLM